MWKYSEVVSRCFPRGFEFIVVFSHPRLEKLVYSVILTISGLGMGDGFIPFLKDISAKK